MYATHRAPPVPQWHERTLQIFMVIVLGHWAEHLAQAWQIFVMGSPRPKANGILGLWYPWLIQSEVLLRFTAS
jgi:hypothetical protein